jgi:hypothetical protein
MPKRKGKNRVNGVQEEHNLAMNGIADTGVPISNLDKYVTERFGGVVPEDKPLDQLMADADDYVNTGEVSPQSEETQSETEEVVEEVAHSQEAEPEVTPEPVQEVVEQVVQPQPEKTPDYEQMYKSLQGMYNKDRKDLQALQAQMAELQNKQTQVPAEQPAPKPVITDQEREEYGEDLIALMERLVDSKLPQVQNNYQKDLEEVKKTVASLSEADFGLHKANFINQVKAQVPNFDTIEADPNFSNWLDAPEPFTGVARRVLLHDTLSSNDPDRAVAFYTAFEGTKGGVTPAPTTPPVQKAIVATQHATPKVGRGAIPQSPQPQNNAESINEAVRLHRAAVERGDYNGRQADLDKASLALDKRVQAFMDGQTQKA